MAGSKAPGFHYCETNDVGLNIVKVLGIGGGGGKSGLYSNLGQYLHLVARRTVADASNIILNTFFASPPCCCSRSLYFVMQPMYAAGPASPNPSIL